MIPTERFYSYPTQLHTELQPDSPVLVYCSRRCVEQRSGAVFLQTRLVNRTDRVIQAVSLRAEGLNHWGEVCFDRSGLLLTDCFAAAHSMFGDDRLLLLERTPVQRLRLRVEYVAFDDGTSWSALHKQTLTTVTEAGWIKCKCSMLNPPGGGRCALCGASLSDRLIPLENAEGNTTGEAGVQIAVSDASKKSEKQPEEQIGTKRAERMQQVLLLLSQSEEQVQEQLPKQSKRKFYHAPIVSGDDEKKMPVGLMILLSVMGALTLAILVAILIYSLYRFL